MIFSTDFILFTVGGQSVSLIEFCSVITGLSCVFMATRGKVANFWIGYAYNILLFVMFMQKHLYSSMLLQPVSLAINFYGHYRWTHPKSGEKDSREELKITLLGNAGRAWIIVAAAVFTFVWGTFLSNLNPWMPDLFPPARQPFLDAFVTSMILSAQFLSAQKKLDCWAVWFIVNITNGILYLRAGLVFMPLVAVGYLTIAIFGFTMWRKRWKEELNN